MTEILRNFSLQAKIDKTLLLNLTWKAQLWEESHYEKDKRYSEMIPVKAFQGKDGSRNPESYVENVRRFCLDCSSSISEDFIAISHSSSYVSSKALADSILGNSAGDTVVYNRYAKTSDKSLGPCVYMYVMWFSNISNTCFPCLLVIPTVVPWAPF